jgi:hypothetical protein
VCREIQRSYFKHCHDFKILNKIGLSFRLFKDISSKTAYVATSETRSFVVVEINSGISNLDLAVATRK